MSMSRRVISYSVGLLLALVLTVAAFSLVFANTNSPGVIPHLLILPVILVLAMVQLVVQLVFFLHLGQSKESRWDAVLFSFTFFGILVVVIASIWIMYHLNYNMTPQQVTKYITDQSGF
jgi:cytochrome o ubiquinol oxidase subunit IV